MNEEVRMSRIDTKLEVVTIPVSDVDRAKRFYEGLGWRSTPTSRRTTGVWYS